MSFYAWIKDNSLLECTQVIEWNSNWTEIGVYIFYLILFWIIAYIPMVQRFRGLVLKGRGISWCPLYILPGLMENMFNVLWIKYIFLCLNLFSLLLYGECDFICLYFIELCCPCYYKMVCSVSLKGLNFLWLC